MALFPKFKLGLLFIYIRLGGGHFAIWPLAPIHTFVRFVSFKSGAVVAVLQNGRLQGARHLESSTTPYGGPAPRKLFLIDHHDGKQVAILQDSGPTAPYGGPTPQKLGLFHTNRHSGMPVAILQDCGPCIHSSLTLKNSTFAGRGGCGESVRGQAMPGDFPPFLGGSLFNPFFNFGPGG